MLYMRNIYTTIDIHAPAETVWEVLTDFAAYPEWNGHTRITGDPAEGARLTVAPGPDAGSMPTFKPRVLRADGNELAWRGHLWVRGLFDGEHSFTVEDVSPDETRLIQSEQFSGVLAGLILRRYGKQTEETFEAVNAALKARAEAMAAVPDEISA
jgi:hypothetical protein